MTGVPNYMSILCDRETQVISYENFEGEFLKPSLNWNKYAWPLKQELADTH